MNSSPLLDIFKHLTKQDRKNLSDFVHSPFHNKREDVVLLFRYLDKNVETPQHLSKETVFRALFPNSQTYNDKTMRYTMSFLMRIYYELGEFSALDSLLESFTVFLHRQKNLGYHKNNYQNLIKFVKKLLQIDLKDDILKAQLKQEIDDTVELTERDWLLAQLK